MNTLTNEQLQRIAPSVFALEPWQEQSDRYKFIPTIDVVNALRDSGYYPVKAVQSNSRIPGKRNFTKHMLRFRPMGDWQVQDIIPEVVLVNSHDGTSSYKMMLGLFRLVCSNGLTVADSTLQQIRVRHNGHRDLCSEVIDISGRIIQDAPRSISLVNNWKQIELTPTQQRDFANKALEVYDSDISIDPTRLLRPRRNEDRENASGGRDLWRTYNVIQENVIRGHIMGKGTNGFYRRTRSITSVDRDIKLNQSLWSIAEEMAGNRAETKPQFNNNFERAQYLVKKYGNQWTNHLHEVNLN